jgi:hypothetical protein
LLLFAIFSKRAQMYQAGSVVERHNWTMWVGHMLATAVVLIVGRFLPVLASLTPHQRILAVYPAVVVLTGLVMFIQGSVFWGLYYLFGLACFALALVMPLTPGWEPLEYGALMSVQVAVLGIKLLQLGRHFRAGSPAITSPPSGPPTRDAGRLAPPA